MFHLPLVEVVSSARLLRRRAHSLDVHPALHRHGRDLLPVAYPNNGVGYCGKKDDADGRQEEGEYVHSVRAILCFLAVVRVRVGTWSRGIPVE